MKNNRLSGTLAACLAAGFLLTTIPSRTWAAGHHHGRLTVAQANRIALRRFPGKVAAKTVLENEKGTWQYGVMVRSGKTLREVMVNAGTGRIDNVEVTTDAKERAEKQAELKHAGAAKGGAARK